MACYKIFASCLLQNVSFCMKRLVYGCIRCNNWVNDLDEIVSDKKETKQEELVKLKINEEYDFI